MYCNAETLCPLPDPRLVLISVTFARDCLSRYLWLEPSHEAPCTATYLQTKVSVGIVGTIAANHLPKDTSEDYLTSHLISLSISIFNLPPSPPSQRYHLHVHWITLATRKSFTFYTSLQTSQQQTAKYQYIVLVFQFSQIRQSVYFPRYIGYGYPRVHI